MFVLKTESAWCGLANKFPNTIWKFYIHTWNIAHHLFKCPLCSPLSILGRARWAALTENCVCTHRESHHDSSDSSSLTFGKIHEVILLFIFVR